MRDAIQYHRLTYKKKGRWGVKLVSSGPRDPKNPSRGTVTVQQARMRRGGGLWMEARRGWGRACGCTGGARKSWGGGRRAAGRTRKSAFVRCRRARHHHHRRRVSAVQLLVCDRVRECQCISRPSVRVPTACITFSGRCFPGHVFRTVFSGTFSHPVSRRDNNHFCPLDLCRPRCSRETSALTSDRCAVRTRDTAIIIYHDVCTSANDDRRRIDDGALDHRKSCPTRRAPSKKKKRADR